MSKYTKTERHEIYKRALNGQELTTGTFFLCHALHEAGAETHYQPKLIIDFPEFGWFRPYEKVVGYSDHGDGYVWVDYKNSPEIMTGYRVKKGKINRLKRIKKTILEFCIEMTKPC